MSYNLHFLVAAIVANKSDLYEFEEVDEGLGRKFAEESNAIFRETSSKNGVGIDELFEYLAEVLLDPLSEQSSLLINPGNSAIILNPNSGKNDKDKECCK